VYAVDEAEVLDRLPWKKGLLPKLPEATPRALTEMESAEAMRVVPERWRPVLLLLAHTGLRWGEARALRWEDVRSSPSPHVVVSRSHDGPTKSRKARDVPLLPEAGTVLDSLADAEGRECHEPVFPWLPEAAGSVRRYVRSHSRLRSLAETFHVHALRHTFATRWLERGGSIGTLQRLLAHSTVALTERHRRLRPWAVAAEARRVADAGTVVGTATGAGEPHASKSLQSW
jgi:integrase